MSKSVIYQTHGRAAEYCPLAINLYNGCAFGCTYCYAPEVAHKEEKLFHDPALVKPRVTPADIQTSAYAVSGQSFSLKAVGFLCDPYQPAEQELRLTRGAFETLHEYGFPVTVLTKAGRLAFLYRNLRKKTWNYSRPNGRNTVKEGKLL